MPGNGNTAGVDDGSDSSRRKFLAAAGVAATAGIAGCSQGETTATPTSGGGNGDDGDGGENGDDGDTPDISGQEVHVLSQENTEAFQNYWDSIAAAFEEETGATVNMEYIGETGSASERIIQLLQANDPPEVAQTVIPSAVTYGAQGVLADHTPIIETMEERYGDFPDQFLFEFDGRNTFVPMTQTFHSQWYRGDVLDEEPNTWEKELAMAEQHDEGAGSTRGQYLSNASELGEPTFSICSRAWGNDAFVCQRDDNGDIQVVMDQEPFKSRWVEVYEHVNELSQYSPDNTGVGYTELFDAMERGATYQMYLYGNRGKDQNINDFVADIQNTTVPVPEDKYEEGGRRSWSNTTGYLTFRGSNETAGQEFLKFWTRPENFYEFFSLAPAHLLPSQPAILEDDDFQSTLEDALGSQWDYERDVVNLVDMAGSSFDLPLETNPPNPYAGPIFSSFEIGKVQRDVVIDGMDPGEAIDNRADNIREVIENTSI